MTRGLCTRTTQHDSHVAAFKAWALADGPADSTWEILRCEAAAIVGPQFTREEIGVLIDCVAATVDRTHQENAPLLKRLQGLYTKRTS